MPDPQPDKRHQPPADPAFPAGGPDTAPPGYEAQPQPPVQAEPTPPVEPEPTQPPVRVADPNAPADPMANVLDSLFDTQEPAAQGSDDGDIKTLLKRLTDRQSTIDRQGSELGDLRREVQSLRDMAMSGGPGGAGQQEPEVLETFDPSLAATDPDYIPKYLEQRDRLRDPEIRQAAVRDVMQEVAPKLAPLVQIQAATRVSESNPLAEAALSNPKMLARVQQLSNDEAALASYYSGQGDNLHDLRLKSAIFDIIGATWKSQLATRVAARADLRANRVDAAGGASPQGSRGGQGPSAEPAETDDQKIAAMGPQEGAKFFSNRFKARRHGNSSS